MKEDEMEKKRQTRINVYVKRQTRRMDKEWQQRNDQDGDAKR